VKGARESLRKPAHRNRQHDDELAFDEAFERRLIKVRRTEHTFFVEMMSMALTS
jgi:hypothetical protein